MRRVELTNAERIEIINHHSEMRISNKALSVWASAKLGKSISEMTISRLLKRKDALLRSTGAKTKKRFKSRHGIFVHVRHGESGSAEITEEVLDRIEGLKALISGYDP
ncbi:hypothetical protein R1sor_007916 [Riccia sorocarpa]|uniref:Transposase n=1 Tax=Riccia sorocarpa TaxID=122646 RepID=A0ABD3HVZ1_9MARC